MGYRAKRMSSRIIYTFRLRRLKLSAAVLVFFAVSTAAAFYVQNNMMPIVKSIATTGAQRRASVIIYDSVQHYAEQNGVTYGELYKITYDSGGFITAVEVNNAAVNHIKTTLVRQIIGEINKIESRELAVPLGSVFPHLFFIGRGPKIPVKLICTGFAAVDCVSTFSEAGINQTHHSVSLDVCAELDIVMPYEIIHTKVSTAVPLVENIIVGKVPQAYLKSDSFR